MADGDDKYYSACDACRARKFKCTKERPSCTPCLQLSLKCVYSRRASRTPLTRGNLTAAEDRVRDLESTLRTLFPEIELDTLLSSIKSGYSSISAGTSRAQSKNKPAKCTAQDRVDATLASERLPRQADGFDWSENIFIVNDVVDGMAALSISPEGAGYLGATSSVVPLRTLLIEDRNAGRDYRDSERWNTPSPVLHQTLTGLPLSTALETAYVDAYFSSYHPSYPFLHEPTFRAQFEGKIPQPEGHSWPILLNAVLALGAWCIGDDDSTIDDIFYRRILWHPEDGSIFEKGNLALFQALLLLSNYVQKKNRPNTGWNYLGLAVRMALSLGLHKEFPDWDIALLQREIRRRAWWGLFIFDSGASITFGRPVLLPENGIMDASQVLNIHEESLTPQTTLLPAEIPYPTFYTALISQSLFHSATNSLHHRLISSPNPSPHDLLLLCRAIDAWEDSIPPYFQLHSADVQANATFLFGRYRLSWRSWNMKIIVFRPVVLQWAARCRELEERPTPETTDEFECRKNCIESASATVKSISDFLAYGIVSRLSTWYALYFLFQAGLVLIICLMADPMHDDAPAWINDIRVTKSILSRTAATNRLAARCLSVFDRVLPVIAPDNGIPEDLGTWEGYSSMEMQNDQFGQGMGFWDWANAEMNWTV